MAKRFELNVNGKAHAIEAEPDMPLPVFSLFYMAAAGSCVGIFPDTTSRGEALQ